MIYIDRKLAFFLLVFNCLVFCANAQFIGQPELSDFNSSGASICEKTSVKIKFDHGGMNPGNVFTVEIAQNGNFNGSNIISMVGSLTQSGGAQNVFLTVSFPGNVLAGNDYKLRVKASNPQIYSNGFNTFPFSVVKFVPSDLNIFPTGHWRGDFYKWNPSTNNVISNANSEDIFNVNNYLGYITEDALSYDYDWTSNTSAPGPFPDTNKVCGTYKDAFSLRMKRRINFEAGYYKFSGGADDGYRLSIDSGVTWIINDWNDHTFRTSSTSGCGIYLTAGFRNVVVDFYEHRDLARFRTEILQTSKSAQFSGLPAEICGDLLPITLVPLNPGGLFSGPGISGNIFSYQVLGSGTYKITHTLIVPGGCSDTISSTIKITIPVKPVIVIPSTLCTSTNPVLLVTNVQGTFSGPGVSGNLFDPVQATIGINKVLFTSIQGVCLLKDSGNINVISQPNAVITIGATSFCVNQSKKAKFTYSPANGTLSGNGQIAIVGDSISTAGFAPGAYTLKVVTESGICKDSATQVFNVYDIPDANFTDLPDTLCQDTDAILLLPNIPGGAFSGEGLSLDGKYFQPSPLLVNKISRVYYSIAVNGCLNQTKDSVMVFFKIKPTITIPFLKNSYCSADKAFALVSNLPGSYFLNGKQVTEIDPAMLNPGQQVLRAVYKPVANLKCMDSASAFFFFSVIANPYPELGPDFEIDEGKPLNLDPKVTGPYTWVTIPEIKNPEASKPLSFVPEKELGVFVLATDPTGSCTTKDSVKFTIRPTISFPSMISPNGDKRNDVFEITGALPNMKVIIFNRWGKEVYSGTSLGNVAWDPKSDVESGMYFYTVSNPGDGKVWNGWLLVNF